VLLDRPGQREVAAEHRDNGPLKQLRRHVNAKTLSSPQ
jgi:hypothetical protein